MWNKQGKSLSIIIFPNGRVDSQWENTTHTHAHVSPLTATGFLVYVHKLHFSDCVYMCQESGSQDKEGSFMDKSGEMLLKVIERERFLLHNQGLVHMCVVWD